jgi:hypothetical protein
MINKFFFAFLWSFVYHKVLLAAVVMARQEGITECFIRCLLPSELLEKNHVILMHEHAV